MMMFNTVVFILMLTSLATDVSSGEICEGITCKRSSRQYYLGFDYGQQSLFIDRGRCELINNIQQQDLEERSGSGSGGGSDGGIESCESNPVCVPEAYSHETVLRRRSGPSHQLSIKSCRTAAPSTCNCQRKPSYHYFYDNTSSYQATMDLGICEGQCNGEEDKCVPTRKVYVAIKGPNGYDTAPNATECGCSYSKCYREDYFQAFSTLIQSEESNDTVVIQEKVVNVGKCVGGCEGIKFPGGCFLFSNEYCIPRSPINAVCVPAKTTAESYVDVGGVTRTIVSIVTCGCGRA